MRNTFCEKFLTDAFGNAIGNSIVSGLSKSPQPSKEDLERQAKLDAMSRQLSQNASKKVNGVLDANLAKTLGKAQETMAVDLNQTVDNFNNFVSSYSAYSSDYELNVAGQLSDYRVTRANNLTASYQAKADALTQRTEYYSPDSVYKRVFADDIATVMATYAKGVRNRPQYGMDVKNEYDWSEILENQRISNWYSKSAERDALDFGQKNAIEFELGGEFDLFIFGGSGHLSLTFDNQQGLTFAGGGNLRGSTNGSIGASVFSTLSKAYGASSEQLGTGVSETTFNRFSATDVLNKVNKNLGTLSKVARPDIGFSTQDGFTLDGAGRPQFAIEGYGLDMEINPSSISEFNNKITNGKMTEVPLGYVYGAEREVSTSLFGINDKNIGATGNVVYGMLNKFFFK